jgi:hypothetical protein
LGGVDRELGRRGHLQRGWGHQAARRLGDAGHLEHDGRGGELGPQPGGGIEWVRWGNVGRRQAATTGDAGESSATTT